MKPRKILAPPISESGLTNSPPLAFLLCLCYNPTVSHTESIVGARRAAKRLTRTITPRVEGIHSPFTHYRGTAAYGKGYREVVQQREGIRVYHP
jgi:hypothetical protein